MDIRPLTTLEECRQVADLERTIWAYTDAEDVVPPPVLIVSIKRGGILLGAFDDAGGMKGFVYSIPAIKNGQTTQWSHMLGVAPDAREAGLGLRLKLAQRDAALRMGIDLIEWSFDPLQAVNAHLNFARLGVVVDHYVVNLYGESTSVLHLGTPTDRLIAEWRLREPHVERRLEQSGGVIARDRSVTDSPVVNPSRAGGAWARPGDTDLTLDARRVLVEIPTGFSEMLKSDPALALEWRLRSRPIFQTYFQRGYRAVDFMLARSRGHYLLARA